MQQELSNTSKRLDDSSSGIEQRTDMLGKLQSTGAVVTADISKFKKTAGTLKLEAEDNSDMPSVMDYLQLKAKEFELSKSLANWKRKVEIAELAAKRSGGSGATTRLGATSASSARK